MSESILNLLLTQAPIVILSCLGLFVLWKDKQKQDAKKEELNGYIREQQKETINTLNKVVSFLDKIQEAQDRTTEEVRTLQKNVLIKLESLNIKNDQRGN